MIGIGIYVKNSPKAIEMYKSAFGLELGYHVLNNDGTYYHSELIKNGEGFCCVVEAKQDTYTDRHTTAGLSLWTGILHHFWHRSIKAVSAAKN